MPITNHPDTDRLTALVAWLRDQIEEEREWLNRNHHRDSAEIAVTKARVRALREVLSELGEKETQE